VRVVSPSLHVSNRKGSVFPRRGRILPFCIRRYSTLTRVSETRFHKQNGGDVCCPVRLGTAHPSLLAVETRCRWAAYEEKPNLKLLLRCVGMGGWGGSSRKLHVSCPSQKSVSSSIRDRGQQGSFIGVAYLPTTGIPHGEMLHVSRLTRPSAKM
jgi:hypothetical protein